MVESQSVWAIWEARGLVTEVKLSGTKDTKGLPYQRYLLRSRGVLPVPKLFCEAKLPSVVCERLWL